MLVAACGGGDTGYDNDDGTDPGDAVEYHSATDGLTLRAAVTAEVLDETTMQAATDVCPMLVYFDAGESTITQSASVDTDAFLLPNVTR